MTPIGVFDSGYGGLTILKALKTELPEYDYLYFGDNARTPYGTRSFDVVYEYTLEAVEKLFDMGCELIILACNTASAKALRSIQQKNLIHMDAHKRVLGVIRPSTEIIGKLSQTKHVGILGTNGTVKSNSYPIEVAKFFPDVQVWQKACPMWVPLVENKTFDTEGGRYFIKEDVQSFLLEHPQIDTLVLACTHYPILKSIIEEYVPSHVKVISQGELVADSLKDYLSRHAELANMCSKGGTIQFITTDDARNFNEKGSIFFGETVNAKQIHL